MWCNLPNDAERAEARVVRTRKALALGIGISLLLLIAACGDSPNKISFQFTPIPVTALPDGTPVSLDANCTVFAADEVVVLLYAEQRSDFERWLGDIGFHVRRVSATAAITANLGPPALLYVIGVPLGSVPDAATTIATRPGVRSAEMNGYGNLPEDLPFGERFFDCIAQT